MPPRVVRARWAGTRIVRRCIEASTPTRVYAVSLGGFDHRADEKGTSRLLSELDAALTGFLDSVEGRPVVVAVYSEFGRRVEANACQGTDHGTAGTMLIAGSPVRGGLYGEQPSLTKLRDGDLAVTTNFRSVYATLLEEVLGTDAESVLEEAPDRPAHRVAWPRRSARKASVASHALRAPAALPAGVPPEMGESLRSTVVGMSGGRKKCPAFATRMTRSSAPAP